MTLHLPAALVNLFRSAPAPIDVLAPPDRPEWEKELIRLRGLTEIHRCKFDNLVFYDFTKKRLSRADTDRASQQAAG